MAFVNKNCNQGWLEPLLFEIKKDKTNVICPIIDVISDETFEFLTGSDLTYGGFNWKLNFMYFFNKKKTR